MNNVAGTWMFERDTVETCATWENVFTAKECEDIIKLGEYLNPHVADVDEQRIVSSARSSKISWIFPALETEWIFQRLQHVVTTLNDKLFKFDIYGFAEGLQFTRYDAPSGHYIAHTDKMPNLTHPRKLSVTVQLSDPSTYEGGDLVMHWSHEGAPTPKDQGRMMLFPSYTLHEVTPVTKGTRYSLVCWVTGRPFK
jgi:PKHD-type hydroxylase